MSGESLYGTGKGARYDLPRSGDLQYDIGWEPVRGWPAKEKLFEPHAEILRHLVQALPPVSMKVVARSRGADIEKAGTPITAHITARPDTVEVSCVNIAGLEVYNVSLEKDVSIAAFESHLQSQFVGYRSMMNEEGANISADSLLIDYAPNIVLRINNVEAAAERYLGCWARELRPTSNVPLGFHQGDDWCVVLLALRPRSMNAIHLQLIHHLENSLPDVFPAKVVEKVFLFLRPQDFVVNVAALNAQANRVGQATGGWYWNRLQVKVGTEPSNPIIFSYDQDTTRGNTRSMPRLKEDVCGPLARSLVEHGIQIATKKPTGLQLAHYIAFVVQALVRPCRDSHAADWYTRTVRFGVRGEKEDTSCIHGQCLITMADRSLKHAEDIRPGELVMTSNGRVALVECTLQQILEGSTINMCQVSPGCLLTLEHPYRLATTREKWLIPGEQVGFVPMRPSKLCNFVLEAGACSVLVGEVECITLGHELDDPAVAHPIWGSAAIRKFLQTVPGYPAIAMHGLFDQAALQLFASSVLAFHQVAVCEPALAPIVETPA